MVAALEQINIGGEKPHPVLKPVCRYGVVLLSDESAKKTPLGDAAIQIWPYMTWEQNPNYGDDPAFLDAYAFCRVIGPGGLIESDEVLAGLLLLGPDTYSFPHYHAAAELYTTIAGQADWWTQEADWHTRDVGTSLFHKPNQPHAIKTKAKPVLAHYVWSGSIHSPSVLVV